MRSIFLLIITVLSGRIVSAQTSDTVIVDLASSSKVIFTIGDRHDIDILRRYDFQALFDDIFARIEDREVSDPPTASSQMPEPRLPEHPAPPSPPTVETRGSPSADMNEPGDSKSREKYKGCCSRHGRTTHAFNFDLGINNFLENGRFPDETDEQYTVRPWGSWYVGINSVLRTHITRHFYIETGLGVSWYNFKFQDESTLLLEGDEGVVFTRDPRDLDFTKSKLTASYLNASFVPMVRLGHHHRHHHRMWKSTSGFRIGAGPYAGYRLAGYTKQVYELERDTEVERNHDNFFLNNLRYGVRLQLGIGDADFFVNYDLNKLFSEDRGPELNAFSFGLIF